MSEDSREKINAEIYEHVVSGPQDHHTQGPKLDVRLADVMHWLDRCENIIRQQVREHYADALKSSIEEYVAEWISVAEAAEILGVHRNRVLQLVNDGALVAHKVGQRWNISRQSVESRAANPPKAGRRWQ